MKRRTGSSKRQSIVVVCTGRVGCRPSKARNGCRSAFSGYVRARESWRGVRGGWRAERRRRTEGQRGLRGQRLAEGQHVAVAVGRLAMRGRRRAGCRSYIHEVLIKDSHRFRLAKHYPAGELHRCDKATALRKGQATATLIYVLPLTVETEISV